MILSCGEALIDMLPRTTPAGESAFAPYAGGAVFNTAIAIGRLGAPSGFFSGLSSDLFGDLLRQVLAESQVDTSPAHVSPRPTTLAFVRLTDGHATYTFYDENTAGRMLSPADLPALSPDVQALFFGGISLVGEPAAQAYEALQTREAPSRVTMVDPNIRPSFITDEGTYRARIGRMIAQAEIVKRSVEDLGCLSGSGAVCDLARALLAQGTKPVSIDEVEHGSTAYPTRDPVHVDTPRVTVADTVGAGDTFNAGVLTALWRAGRLSKDAIATLDASALRDALTLGVQAAAITVSRPGANPPWAHEL